MNSSDKPNFDWMNDYKFQDLMALCDEVQGRIEAMRDETIADLRRDILAQADLLGIKPHDLLESPSPKAKRHPARREPLPAKYRDPESGKTWSGKGKRPGWFDSERIHELRI